MNGSPTQPRSHTADRYAWRAHFISRLNRLKNLMTSKWWIPVLALGTGLTINGLMWRSERPVYISSGRMIVSIKLSLPEGSVYNEELNNFLGTQAALMQSGVVLNRAYAGVAAAHPDWPMQTVSPARSRCCPKPPFSCCKAPATNPGYIRRSSSKPAWRNTST